MIPNCNTSVACCCVHFEPISLHLTVQVDGRLDSTSAFIQWRGLEDQCDDIVYYRDPSGDCKQFSCGTQLPVPGLSCPNGYLVVVLGYWYKQGFDHYVMSCPLGSVILIGGLTQYHSNHFLMKIFSVVLTKQAFHVESVKMAMLSNMEQQIVFWRTFV